MKDPSKPLKNVAVNRLISQHIDGSFLTTVKELAGWMGAMQAQDFVMLKWAIGIRLPGSTEKYINDAINKGEVIRTHLMRPTWHLVSVDDIRWMLDLTAPRIRKVLSVRHKGLEIDNKLLRKSNLLLEKNLAQGNHLTREELKTIYEKAGIANNDNRMAHLLLYAELDKFICSGITRGRSSTYALFDERVAKQKSVARSEALARLALRYFTSHGPATLSDFNWWSGLNMGDARMALYMVKENLVSERRGKETFWFAETFRGYSGQMDSVHLLPAFDEFIISYKDRSASLSERINGKAVSSNGIFRPVILEDGKVTGLWKRIIKNNKLILETEFFGKPDKSVAIKLDEAIHRYRNFTGS